MPAAVGAGGQRGGPGVLPAQPQGGHTGGSSNGGYTREEVARVAAAAVTSNRLQMQTINQFPDASTVDFRQMLAIFGCESSPISRNVVS